MTPRTPSTTLPAVGDVYASTDARDVPVSEGGRNSKHREGWNQRRRVVNVHERHGWHYVDLTMTRTVRPLNPGAPPWEVEECPRRTTTLRVEPDGSLHRYRLAERAADLFVVALPTTPEPGEVTRHTVVAVREAWGGGMVEFIDPVHGDTVGCAGIEWWKVNAVRADAFLQKVRSV